MQLRVLARLAAAGEAVTMAVVAAVVAAASSHIPINFCSQCNVCRGPHSHSPAFHRSRHWVRGFHSCSNPVCYQQPLVRGSECTSVTWDGPTCDSIGLLSQPRRTLGPQVCEASLVSFQDAEVLGNMLQNVVSVCLAATPVTAEPTVAAARQHIFRVRRLRILFC